MQGRSDTARKSRVKPVSVAPTGARGVNVGARARELAEVNERLRRERALSELIIESAAEGIIVVDTELRHLVWNPAIAGIHGTPRSEVLGKTVFEVTPGFADHPVGRAWRRAVSGERAEIRDFRFFSPARGAEVVYNADFTPLYARDGAIVGAICILHETTDRHRVEEMLRQSQKLKAVAQLTGGVAHDFNNLLTAVVGCLELIRLQTADERTANLAATALRSANRGAVLVQQLLAFASRQELRAEATDLDALLHDIEVLLARAVGDSIDIILDNAPGLWRCEIDAAQLEAAVMNLVINARDAMPRGGWVTLRTRNVTAEELPADADLRPGEYVALAVEDNGEGMTSEVMARAFEPFYTTKETGKGTGLGLSMVYGFARQSGGGVRLESTRGAGTCVTLYLPRASLAAAAPDRDGAAETAQRGSGSILVVEDDRHVGEVSVAVLSSLGYRVSVAGDSTTALEALRCPDPIDLLFIDLAMPNGISGVALAREARLIRPNLPVLLTTGYADDGPEAKEFPIIAKPFRRTGLGRLVAELMATTRGPTA
ncbi:MAG TPA: ATP-binding protein [Stellaceae bacterium]|nr:ATP-binding protein [Stellaceae bacterium]